MSTSDSKIIDNYINNLKSALGPEQVFDQAEILQEYSDDWTEIPGHLPGVVVNYDQHGHIRLDEIPLHTILKREIQNRFKERGEALGIVERTIGYELRSASPIPFDVDYTRTLGYGAVRFLLSDTDDERLKFGGLICQLDGHRKVLAFDDLRDPETGRIRVRRVDIESEYYAVAREYMIRLDAEDWADRQFMTQVAQAANMSLDDFERAFGGVGGTYSP